MHYAFGLYQSETYISMGEQKDFVQLWEPHIHVVKDGNVSFT